MSKLIFLDMVSMVTTVIRHPIDVVWPKLLDQAIWMKEFKVETIDGERHKEGELKKVTPLQPEFQPFFFKTLRLIPYRKFVYKAYTDNRAGEYGFTGIEVLSVDAFGEDSAVKFEAYLEVQSSTMTSESLNAFVAKGREGSIVMWQRNFERLASLVASESHG